MLKAIIVDDEKNSRELLGAFLAKYCPDVKVLHQAENIELAVRLIESSSPDLIFLDIELSDGTGFDILDQLKTKDVLVCFVTGYDNYAIKAIKYGAFDYILKPLDKQELIEVVEKVKIYKAEHNTEKSSLLINQGNKVISIAQEDLVYIEVSGNYSILHMTDNRKIISGENLSHLENVLPENNFVRVHKSFIINLSQIKEIELNRSGTIILNSGANLPLASRRKKRFIELLKAHMDRNNTIITF